MLPPILPTEVVLEILSYIDNSSNSFKRRATLFSCCLVSHTWKALAQPLLLSRVIVKIGTPGIQKLADKIQRSPNSKDQVNHLYIDASIGNLLFHFLTITYPIKPTIGPSLLLTYNDPLY
ncbi:hypothetical protein BDN72DRAFT_839455 [Pluteus cervinus]|uniref:Uncharacterized protein n=1 Tax=Pluteus cervinus TaxID=181527 RepID=A0ACD3AX16_9AGAR|nr:hypothetical protein BDN72DRAFT_839455 [Pluteus cervinus]